jgi:hypothetical protein
MAHTLLIAHFIGLMLGFAGAVGGTTLLAQARPSQKQKAGPMRRVGPSFARMATLGFTLTAGTGTALATISPALDLADAMLWMKSVFVGLLGLATLLNEIIYHQARRRDPAALHLLPSLWPLAVMSWLIAMTFSVLAFG